MGLGSTNIAVAGNFTVPGAASVGLQLASRGNLNTPLDQGRPLGQIKLSEQDDCVVENGGGTKVDLQVGSG